MIGRESRTIGNTRSEWARRDWLRTSRGRSSRTCGSHVTRLRPQPRRTRRAACGASQWTQSAYVGYPNFRPAPRAVGEYSGTWMADQWVLRGASCVTPRSHARLTYRNYFPSEARWQFTGIRLADGATGAEAAR